MPATENELTDLEVPRVDLVNIPANRRKFAIYKSEDGRRDEMAEDKSKDVAQVTPEGPVAKTDEITVEKAVEFLKGHLTPAVVKALEDLLGDKLKKPLFPPEEQKPVAKSAEVVAIEKENTELKERLVKLEKASRMKDLEPICKGMGLDAEKVFGFEQVAKEATQYFMDALATARKQNEGLMKELGTSTEVVGKGEDAFMVEVDKRAKADKIDSVNAAVLVAKERPELFNERVAARQSAGR